MSAQPAIQTANTDETELLDADTSAAILKWMETGSVPSGIDPVEWERWADGGCRWVLDAGGVSVSPAMLGNWARTGALR